MATFDAFSSVMEAKCALWIYAPSTEVACATPSFVPIDWQIGSRMSNGQSHRAAILLITPKSDE